MDCIMSNTSEQSWVGELQTPPPHQTFQLEPTVETTQGWNPPFTQEEGTQTLKELFSQPYIMNTSINKPPSPALIEAGEKAMSELGLSSPIAPSIQLNPSWTRKPLGKNPEMREFYSKQAAESRKQAQGYAQKADDWRHQFSLELSKTGRGEIKDEKERKQQRKLLRQAKRMVKWCEKRAMVAMTSAYVDALMATHSPASGTCHVRRVEGISGLELIFSNMEL